jgi:serine/threonine protein kinase
LSKENVTENSKTKSFCGSPAYLAPEIVNGQGSTRATDLYGLGAVLYDML